MITTMPDGTRITTMLSQRDFNRHMLNQHNESMGRPALPGNTG